MIPAARVVDALMTLDPGESLVAPGSITWRSFDEVEAPTCPDTFESVRAIRGARPPRHRVPRLRPFLPVSRRAAAVPARSGSARRSAPAAG